MKSNKRVLISSILCGLLSTCSASSCVANVGGVDTEVAQVNVDSKNVAICCHGEGCIANSNSKDLNSDEVHQEKSVNCEQVVDTKNESEGDDCENAISKASEIAYETMDNSIPIKISLSDELEKAIIKMMNSTSDLAQQSSKTCELLGSISAKCDLSDVESSSVSVITKEDFEQNRSKFYPACVSLKNDVIDLSKPVYYTVRWQESLREIAKKLLGSMDKADAISSISENAKVISSIAAKDYLPEYETLVIPQPTDVDFVLYCRNDRENYYDIARKFYGSWVYAVALANFNGDHSPGSTYEKVVRLPRKLYLDNYLVDDSDTPVKISRNLFGTDKYATQIAELNNLTDIDKPLKRETCLKIPYVEQNFDVL